MDVRFWSWLHNEELELRFPVAWGLSGICGDAGSRVPRPSLTSSTFRLPFPRSRHTRHTHNWLNDVAHVAGVDRPFATGDIGSTRPRSQCACSPWEFH